MQIFCTNFTNVKHSHDVCQHIKIIFRFSFRTPTLSLGMVKFLCSSFEQRPFHGNGQVHTFYSRTTTLSLGMVKSRFSFRTTTLSLGMVKSRFSFRTTTLSLRMVKSRFSFWTTTLSLRMAKSRLSFMTTTFSLRMVKSRFSIKTTILSLGIVKSTLLRRDPLRSNDHQIIIDIDPFLGNGRIHLVTYRPPLWDWVNHFLFWTETLYLVMVIRSS